MLDKVSIVMCSYNSSKFISDSILSIINQTYPNWELLITDDCSTDKTCEIIKNFQLTDGRIKLFKLDKNSGPGVARNISIKNSSGKYLSFCDSDDKWKPLKLEKQISFMKLNNLSFTYCSYEVINHKGLFLKKINTKLKISYTEILRNNYICCSTAIYDTKRLGKLYMPIIRKRQDWVLWIRILKVKRIIFGMSECLVSYRDSKDSISSKKISLIKYNWSVYRHELKFSLIKSYYMMLKFMYYYFQKKLKQ